MSSRTGKQKPKIPPKPPDLLNKKNIAKPTSSSRTITSKNHEKSRPLIPPKPSHLSKGIKKEKDPPSLAVQNDSKTTKDMQFTNTDGVSLKNEITEGLTNSLKPSITSVSQDLSSHSSKKETRHNKYDVIPCDIVNLENQVNVEISTLNVSRKYQTDNNTAQNKSKAHYDNDENTQRNLKGNELSNFDTDKSTSTDVIQLGKQYERDTGQNTWLNDVHREKLEGCSISDETFKVADTFSETKEFNVTSAINIKFHDESKLNISKHDKTNCAHHEHYQSSLPIGTQSTVETIDARKRKTISCIEEDNEDEEIGSTNSSSSDSLSKGESRNKNDNTETENIPVLQSDGFFVNSHSSTMSIYKESSIMDDPVLKQSSQDDLTKVYISTESETGIQELKYKERRNDKEFFVPLNLREEKTVEIDSNKTLTSELIYERIRTPPPSIPPRNPMRPLVTKLFYISTYNLGPQHHEYLTISKGELLEILNDNYKDKGYWMARNGVGKKGLIPSKFVSDNPELDMYSWFYKDLHRLKCEFILRKVETDGCFIVWQNDELKYSLSVFTDDASGGRVNHYHIYRAGTYFYLSKNTMFVSLPDLLEYHTRRSGDLHTLLCSPPPMKYKETLEANELEYSHTHKLEIERTDLEFIKKIGIGSFGEVHRGKFRGSDIAVETMKDVNCSQDVLLMEATILAQLSHPNIVQLYGIVTKSLPVIKVTELMQNGNLLNHLRQNKFSLISDSETLTNMCRQVCSGLEYIHSRGYIHRNIAARSCLVGINGTVKIADFSQAKYVRKKTTITYSSYRLKWTPPEILYTQAGNFKSDIWSYGVLMWEIFTCGGQPYSNVADATYKRNIRSKNYRLPKPPTCSTTIYSIMYICWEEDPSLRPTLRYLLSCLEEDNLKIIEEIINSEPQLPSDLGFFDPRDRELFLLALNEGKESDNFMRVMVVGNFNQGKTSLTRRLLGLPLEGIESTDGIDIHKATCNMEDITWTKSELNSSETSGANRLVKIVKQPKDQKPEPEFLMYTADEKEPDFESLDESENSSAEQNGFQEEDITRDDIENKNGLQSHAKPNSDFSLDTASSSDSSSELDESDESTDLNMTEIFSFHNNSQTHVKGIDLLRRFSQRLMNETDADEMSNAKESHLNIWDFGGQFIYYATHQIFHSDEAIYLLVFDLTKDLDSVVKDDDFPDRKTDMRTSMKFWVESVHAFVGTEDGYEPKIILVGTHKAECRSESDIEQKFDEVLDIFDRTKARNHIYKQPFAIEITDPDDPCIEEIRRTIVHIGSEKAKSREVPAKWIQLEVALNDLRNERKIVQFADVVDLNASTDSPIQDEEGIKVFLKYHHSKGTLVYFDESRLNDFVVIDPQFLVDAFKCIITSKRFCKWRPELHGLWQKLIESAVLERYLLNSVWENAKENPFMEHRNILLAFLQRHRILAEILTFDDVNCDERVTGKYIVPSLLKSECTHSTIQRVMHGKKCSMVILGLQLKESSIIKTIFERVIAAALGKWPPLEIEKKKLVFQSTAFFRLDLQHAGIISNPSENGIEMSVIAQCPPDGVEPDVCGHFRRFVEAVILNEFQRHNSERQDKPYSYFIKCNHVVHDCKGSTNAHHGFDNIKQKYRVCCPDNESHAINTKQALGEWFPEQKIDKDERARNTTITEKHLAKIAQAIGNNWELLGPFLGLHGVDVERIKQDHSFRSETAIYNMLNTWRKQNPKQDTLFDLLKVLKECEKVSVNWDKIYNILDEI